MIGRSARTKSRVILSASVSTSSWSASMHVATYPTSGLSSADSASERSSADSTCGECRQQSRRPRNVRRYREPPQYVAGGAEGNVVAGARPESAFDTPPLLRVALDRDFFPFQFFGGRARDHVTCDDPERLHKEGHNPTDHEGVSQHICCRPRRRRCHHNVATSAERKTHRAPNHVRICEDKKYLFEIYLGQVIGL